MKNNLLTIYLLKKDIVFSIPIEKEVPKTDKSREEIAKTISYRLQFIDNTIFMASSLWNLTCILADGIHKIKNKYRHDEKNMKFARN